MMVESPRGEMSADLRDAKRIGGPNGLSCVIVRPPTGVGVTKRHHERSLDRQSTLHQARPEVMPAHKRLP